MFLKFFCFFCRGNETGDEKQSVHSDLVGGAEGGAVGGTKGGVLGGVVVEAPPPYHAPAPGGLGVPTPPYTVPPNLYSTPWVSHLTQGKDAGTGELRGKSRDAKNALLASVDPGFKMAAADDVTKTADNTMVREPVIAGGESRGGGHALLRKNLNFCFLPFTFHIDSNFYRTRPAPGPRPWAVAPGRRAR